MPPMFSFFSPLVEGSGGVALVERRQGHKHVAGWKAGVRSVTFPNNHYLSLHVVVHEVNQ